MAWTATSTGTSPVSGLMASGGVDTMKQWSLDDLVEKKFSAVGGLLSYSGDNFDIVRFKKEFRELKKMHCELRKNLRMRSEKLRKREDAIRFTAASLAGVKKEYDEALRLIEQILEKNDEQPRDD